MFKPGQLWRNHRGYDIDIWVMEVVAVTEKSSLLFVEYRNRHSPDVCHSAERIRIWADDYEDWSLVKDLRC